MPSSTGWNTPNPCVPSTDIWWYHFEELRQSNPASAVVGTSTQSQFSCDGTADDVEIQAAIDYVDERFLLKEAHTTSQQRLLFLLIFG